MRERLAGVDEGREGVNLKSHHGRLNVVRGFRNRLIALNSPGRRFDYPTDDVAFERIAIAVIKMRPGLDGRKLDEMIWALWRCDD